jgi:hypothetical protein
MLAQSKKKPTKGDSPDLSDFPEPDTPNIAMNARPGDGKAPKGKPHDKLSETFLTQHGGKPYVNGFPEIRGTALLEAHCLSHRS